MKKHFFLLLTLAAMALQMAAAPTLPPRVDKMEPPHWWTGMQQDTLQVMVYGVGIGSADVTMAPYEGVTLNEVVRTDSPDYLLLYFVITDAAQPGKLQLTFTKGKKSLKKEYELKARTMKPEEYSGFDASDVLYLIMPDRFARIDEGNQAEIDAKLEFPTKDNRQNPHARHGGNIAGMQSKLDYIDELGVTAVWVNPVLTNDMRGGSYHGYATTDYYSIDPRFGTNEQWNDFVAEAHKHGIKVVMDMIFNHSGSNHAWLKNPPTKDWFNHQDSMVQTNHRLSTVYDPYASDFDKSRMVDGWFVATMPDLNQRNEHLMKYLIQNSIWWIENSKINGIRMDTHPYADERGMAEWIESVMAEYPHFNIVGECWYDNEGSSAYWQHKSKVNPNGDPALRTVMDFVIGFKAKEAFSDQTENRKGLNIMYDHLALDYLFPDPKAILTFLDNHDTDRFLLEEPKDLGSWKQALTFLLTTRGIPQLYYGTEILMHGSKAGGDGHIRQDMPGGFPGDTVSVFTAEGRTPMQQEAFAFLSKLLNWRRGNEVIANGSLKHFIPESGVYVYERRLGDKQVVVLMNGRDTEVTMPMEQTAEVLPYGATLTDMLTGSNVTITPEMTFAPRQIMILEN